MVRKAEKRTKYRNAGEEGELIRVKLPRGKQVIGFVEGNVGFCNFKARCTDDKVRLCRIPGKLKRNMWIRENNIVLVEPWPVQSDERGDIIYKYRDNEVYWLKKNGHLKALEELI
ncbi:MAG: translation initiation factor eIF-1A [Candidatus Nanoarchaeia archaeon]|nr:translation initiation factor eIF-1A [Candidatus Nanoarchaeia archaeon]